MSRAEMYRQMLRVEREATRNGHQLSDFVPHPGGPIRFTGIGFSDPEPNYLKVASCERAGCGARCYVNAEAGFDITDVVKPCAGQGARPRVRRRGR